MSIFNLLTPVLGAVNNTVKTVFGDKAARDQFSHEENTATLAQYAAEFQSRPERNTWFDSFVDGLNRLQRPTYTFSVLAIFWLAFRDTQRFAEIMEAFSLVPEQFWVLAGIIVGFLFSSRMIENLPISQVFKGVSKEEVKSIREAAKEIATRRPQNTKPDHIDTAAEENKSIAAWKNAGKPWVDPDKS